MQGEGVSLFFHNPSKFVCFACCVGFVRDRGADDHPGWDIVGQQHECPNCGSKMFDVGRDVALPRKQDKGGWRDLRLKTYQVYTAAISREE